MNYFIFFFFYRNVRFPLAFSEKVCVAKKLTRSWDQMENPSISSVSPSKFLVFFPGKLKKIKSF